MTTKNTPWDRVNKSLKTYEERHYDDNAIPRFEPSPSDVRQILEQNTILIAALMRADHYLVELKEAGYGVYPQGVLGSFINGALVRAGAR